MVVQQGDQVVSRTDTEQYAVSCAYSPTPILPITTTAILGVTAPVAGAKPVTTTTDGTGYTGAVTWSP